MHSAIYEGRVRHRRYTPVAHAFQYRLFLLYLDLAELPRVFAGNPLWSNEGHGLARFRRRDHLRGLAPADRDLRLAVGDLVEERTGRRPGGPIRLLTHLEYFRYRFNPVSFFYCFDAADQRVETVVAEINNTPWGEQHCYVLPAAGARGASAPLRFEFAKSFHISPFMGMDTEYTWRLSAPGAHLAIHMENRRAGACYFDATLALRRRALSRAALTRVLLRYPFQTAQVIGAIYWQALRLWLKGCPYVPHPRAARTQPEGDPCGPTRSR